MTDQTWLDPWLKIREKTSHRNELLQIADRYSKMQRLAMAQLAELRKRPKSRPDTLAGLEEIIRFCGERGQPLFDKVAVLDAELAQETEALNHD